MFVTADKIPEKFRLPERPYNLDYYLCNGQLIEWSGATSNVYSPILEKVGSEWKRTFLGTVPIMDHSTLFTCLNSSVAAYNVGAGAWPTTSIPNRVQHVEKFAQELIKRKVEIVKLLMWEIGKSYDWALDEFDRTLRYIRNVIDRVKVLDRADSKFKIVEGIIAQVRRASLGVVFVIGPYNYPFNETMVLLIPALLMGNTALVKPPRFGTLLFRPIFESLAASFPHGVVNSVIGPGATIIEPLVSQGTIDSLAYIGSAATVDKIRLFHPHPHRMRCLLGLDAKNPAIVTSEVDLELAAKEIVNGAFSFNGQRRTAIKIAFVHRSIVDKFVQRAAELTNGLPVGLPWADYHSFVTPLPEPGKVDKMKEFLNDAVSKGANVINSNGGANNLSILFPAVVYPVTSEMRLFHEEQYGPLLPIVPYADIKVPLQFIEDSRFSQQVSIFGKSSDHIAKLIDLIVNQICRVNINCQCQRGPDEYPFSGRKDSAEQTMSLEDTLKFFSIRTVVATKHSPANVEMIQEITHARTSAFLSTDFIF